MLKRSKEKPPVPIWLLDAKPCSELKAANHRVRSEEIRTSFVAILGAAINHSVGQAHHEAGPKAVLLQSATYETCQECSIAAPSVLCSVAVRRQACSNQLRQYAAESIKSVGVLKRYPDLEARLN